MRPTLVVLLGRLGRCRDGAVLPLVAVSLAALIGVMALSVDVGSLFTARRRVQGAADLAALVAAQAPDQAERLARLSLADNGIGDPAGLVIQPGRYVADRSLGPTARFVSGAAPYNAVRVQLTTSAPLAFGRFLTGQDAVPIGAVATATRADLAVVSIGSRLASVQGGVANAVLGALLGTRLSLSAMDYQALASAKVDAFRTLDALATSLDLTGPTYADVLAGQASVGQVALALANASQDSGAGWPAVSALRSAAASLSGVTTRVPLGRLLSLGDLGGTAIGSGGATRPISVNALGLLSGLAQIANGDHQVQVDLGANLPGVSSATLSLAIGERPQSVAGPAAIGTTVRTAQTRLLLEARIAAPLGIGTLSLPVYVELAPASATLTGISCPWTGRDGVSATVSAQPGLANAAVAAIAPGWAASGWTAPGTPSPDLTRPATLVDLPALRVTGQSRITIASPAPRELTFGDADIAAGRVRTVGTSGIAGSLVSSLVGNLVIQADVAGLGIAAPSSVRSSVAAALASASPSLDAALDTTLRTLGIGLGEADVWVDSVRCDRSVLVQ